MLKIFAPRDGGSKFCDGISRRNFLKIGGLGTAGLSLPRLLAAESKAGIGSSQKSVILIYLVGGPPHQDMFDLKKDAPSQIAGPMRPIGTSVPGIEICELFPQIGSVADDICFIRSMHTDAINHDPAHCFINTGSSIPGRPSGPGWPGGPAGPSTPLAPSGPGLQAKRPKESARERQMVLTTWGVSAARAGGCQTRSSYDRGGLSEAETWAKEASVDRLAIN